MAVYTQLSAHQIAQALSHYHVGTLRAAKGIAEGVSNSNWLIETEQEGRERRFVLTVFEARTPEEHLPFFLALLDHLAAKGLPVPPVLHTRDDARATRIKGKPAALIAFVPGVSVTEPNVAQAKAVGEALAKLHFATGDFALERANDLTVHQCASILKGFETSALAGISPELPPLLDQTIPRLLDAWPTNLPSGTVHSDLFPDNVLFLDDRITGLIDFYFACDDAFAYDLAVTHAAWCFDETGTFRADIGEALMAGYETSRSLSAGERAALPWLAQGAALRFVATRVQDWFAVPDESGILRKDPMEFARRLAFYASEGEAIFTR